MSGQMQHKDSPQGMPSSDELHFSRVNAVVLMSMYVCYLLFQLGTHKEEFDEEENIVETPDNVLILSPHFTSRHGRKKRAARNNFCMKLFFRETQRHGYATVESATEHGPLNKSRTSDTGLAMGAMDNSDLSDSDESENKNEGDEIFRESLESALESQSLPSLETGSRRRHRRGTEPSTSNGAVNGVVILQKTSRDANVAEAGGDLHRALSNNEERGPRELPCSIVRVESRMQVPNIVAHFCCWQRSCRSASELCGFSSLLFVFLP
jgi:hypothetical protein